MKASRDPGLQPERTSLAWLRTHMVLFGVALLLLKVSANCSSLALLLNATGIILFVTCCSFYSRRRFTSLFNRSAAVGNHEAHIKKCLSLIIFISAMLYAALSVLRYSI